MLLTTYLAVLLSLIVLPCMPRSRRSVVHIAATLVRSNADREVGLSLYTDWQMKNWRALASHAPKNNRQEERAPCLTRDTRFGRFKNNRQEERAPGLTRCTRSADSRSKSDGRVPGTLYVRTRAVRTRAVRVQRARACNRARVRVPSLLAGHGAWRRQRLPRSQGLVWVKGQRLSMLSRTA